MGRNVDKSSVTDRWLDKQGFMSSQFRAFIRDGIASEGFVIETIGELLRFFVDRERPSSRMMRELTKGLEEMGLAITQRPPALVRRGNFVLIADASDPGFRRLVDAQGATYQ